MYGGQQPGNRYVSPDYGSDDGSRSTIGYRADCSRSPSANSFSSLIHRVAALD